MLEADRVRLAESIVGWTGPVREGADVVGEGEVDHASLNQLGEQMRALLTAQLVAPGIDGLLDALEGAGGA